MTSPQHAEGKKKRNAADNLLYSFNFKSQKHLFRSTRLRIDV